MPIEECKNIYKSLFQIVQNVTKECDSRNLYKKPMPRPVVSLPRATSFNDNVAMDLHHLNENLWYLHFIDEFSRFSTDAIIRNKHPNTVMQIFFETIDKYIWNTQFNLQ